jgi:O-antigen ligase
VVSFFISGGGFDHEDIYGEVVGGFVSNHYGWSCILFLATSIDILRNKSSLSVKRRILIILCCLIAVYILAISGSRSAYLSFAVCFILFILKNKSTSFAIKILSTIAAIGFILNLYSDRDSALNKRFQKTETQLEKGDARSAIYDLGFVTMADNPVTLITGFGFYTPAEAMLILNKNANKKVLEVYSLHNSYLELLFGSGLFIFAFFLVFFVGNTVWCFTIRHSSRYIFLPPILLIPFFENNFNPGQFLFFPWFIIMLYYIHYNERQIKIEDNLNMHFIPKKNVFL